MKIIYFNIETIEQKAITNTSSKSSMLKPSTVSGRRSNKAQDGGGRRIDRVDVLDNGDREAPETISGLYIARSQSIYTLLFFAGFLTVFL